MEMVVRVLLLGTVVVAIGVIQDARAQIPAPAPAPTPAPPATPPAPFPAGAKIALKDSAI